MITAFWPNMVGKLCISKPIVATRKPGFMSLLYNSGEACEHGWTVGEANIRSLLFLCLIWPPPPPKKKKYRGPGTGPGPIFLKMEALCVSVLLRDPEINHA